VGCCNPAGGGKHPQHHAAAAQGWHRAGRGLLATPACLAQSIAAYSAQTKGLRVPVAVSIACHPSDAALLCIALQEVQDRFCCFRPCMHRLGWALRPSVSRERGCTWISTPAQVPPALRRCSLHGDGYSQAGVEDFLPKALRSGQCSLSAPRPCGCSPWLADLLPLPAASLSLANPGVVHGPKEISGILRDEHNLPGDSKVSGGRGEK